MVDSPDVLQRCCSLRTAWLPVGGEDLPGDIIPCLANPGLDPLLGRAFLSLTGIKSGVGEHRNGRLEASCLRLSGVLIGVMLHQLMQCPVRGTGVFRSDAVGTAAQRNVAGEQSFSCLGVELLFDYKSSACELGFGTHRFNLSLVRGH